MKLLISLLLTLPLFSWGQDAESIPYIRKDSFVSNTFGFPATIKNFTIKYVGVLSISKRPVENVYDNSVNDTVYTFSYGMTKIEIYHAKDRDHLQSAITHTDKIYLKYNIKVGNTKTDISQRLNTKIISDEVQIGNLEQTEVYTFNFSKDKLISITYEGYIE